MASKPLAREHVPGGNLMIFQKDKQFNILPFHIRFRKYIQYYNVEFPGRDAFFPQYRLMPCRIFTITGWKFII